MRKTPDFGRFLTALRRGTPDRVPPCELSVDTEVKELFLGRSIASPRDDVEFWLRASYDYIIVSTKGQPIPDEVSQEALAYPAGQRVHEHRWAVSGQGAVTSWQTFASYPWITAAQVDYRAVDDLRSLLPDGMMAVANQGPLYSGVWRLMGMEAFSLALVDNPELGAAVYRQVGELSVQIAETNAQTEWVGALWLGDDIAYDKTLLTSPAIFRRYALPYYQRIGEVCRKYNKPLIYHSDGNVLPVLEDLIEEAGIAALHPIEPKAMDIRQVKREYGQRVALIGNVDVDLLSRGTPDAVAARTRELLREIAPGGGYLLGSSNSIPYYVPLANYRAMLDTLARFGEYPSCA
ncbi:MAG: nucleoside 2-deoxyribosyltransferase [Anaerolineae bacterium]|nr:nucleoside 2-deoxyribosyltransferase [Anaerolineae bacterium]